MNKLKMVALALSIGAGLSGVVSTSAVARPNAASCIQLADQCANGDARSCQTYNLFCLPCELDPTMCEF